MKLTQEQIDNYVSSGGTICPWCNEEDIQGVGGVDVNDGVGIQLVQCYTCKKLWNDIYKLVNITL